MVAIDRKKEKRKSFRPPLPAPNFKKKIVSSRGEEEGRPGEAEVYS
jgi:hypothetical protein